MIEFLKLFIQRSWVLIFILGAVLIITFNEMQSADDILNEGRSAGDYIHSFSYGLQSFDRNYFKRARGYYHTLLLGRFQTPLMNSNLGFTEYYLGNRKVALQIYQQLVKDDPNNYVFHFDLAILYFEEKDYVKSKEHFNKSIQVYPANKQALLDMLHILPRYRSRTYFDDLYTHRTTWDAVIILLYQCAVDEKLGDSRSLLINAAEGIRTASYEPEFFYFASQGAFQLGLIPQSLEFINRAIEFEPKMAKAYQLRSKLNDVFSAKEAALVDSQTAVQLIKKGGWERKWEIPLLHHWDESIVLYQIYN